MIYNFDQVIERRGSGCFKWDTGAPDVLPMWVADMDFQIAEPIKEALHLRTDHGIFGYSVQGESYYEAAMGWFKRRHGWTIRREWFSLCPGIVPALHFLAKAYCKPGDKIMMHSPVYYPFFEAAESNGVGVVNNYLLNINGRYEIDFDNFEAIAKDPHVKLFFLCSPHNPGGRIWTKDELTKMGRICLENDVIVVSDEIHCDLIYSGKQFVAFGTLPEDIVKNSIICVAPSKTFNLAGLQTSCLIIPDEEIKAAYDKYLGSLGIMRPNAYGIAGLKAAYNHGDEWVDQLMEYLKGNLDYLKAYVAENLPYIKIMEPDATYLIWMDFSALGMDPEELHNLILEKGKLWLDQGYMFGKSGEGFERINIACPRSVLEDGLKRLSAALEGISAKEKND